jgi:DNA processing protein
MTTGIGGTGCASPAAAASARGPSCKLLSRFDTAAEALEALPAIAAKAGRSARPADPADIDAELAAAERRRRTPPAARRGGLSRRRWPRSPTRRPASGRGATRRSRRGPASPSSARATPPPPDGASRRRWRAISARLAGWWSPGFARGIDRAAHQAALETGTVAAMAGGVDIPYPPENAALAADDRRTRPPALRSAAWARRPTPRSFPKRNRIVSGLSAGVVLVEAAERSGSLITARFALEQGREVMAAPGSPLEARAAGCNALIRDGAALIRNAEDVIEALGSPRARTLRRSTRALWEAGAPVR